MNAEHPSGGDHRTQVASRSRRRTLLTASDHLLRILTWASLAKQNWPLLEQWGTALLIWLQQ